MRIAFANSSRIWGGAEVMTAALMQGLQQRRHDVMLFCRRDSPFVGRTGDIPHHPTLGGFDVNPWSIARTMRRLARNRPDVLITMTQKDPRIAGIAARMLGIPVLLRQPMDLGFSPSLRHRLFYGVVPTHYVANSLATKRSMTQSASWLDPDDIAVIYNGIDVDRFADATPAHLELPAGSIAVGYAARFEVRKGTRELMQAWSAVVRAVDNAYLVLAGEGGALDAEVREWAARTERVCMIGFRTDMPSVMKALDMLLVPSHFEGFGIVLAEAMAAGVPVIASRASNLPELMDDGVEGLFVPVRDADALANAIIALARDPARRTAMGSAGRTRAQRDYRIERMVDQYEQLLDNIVHDRSTAD